MTRYQISYEDLRAWRAGDEATIQRVRAEAVRAASSGQVLIIDQDDNELETLVAQQGSSDVQN